MQHHAGFVRGVGLGGEDDLLAFCAEGGADHALVVAVLVAARGIEIIDAQIDGALDDAGVRGDHATEADGGDFEAGAAKGFIGELDGRVGGSGVVKRFQEADGWSCAGQGSKQAGGKAGGNKTAAGCSGRHEDTSAFRKKRIITP